MTGPEIFGIKIVTIVLGFIGAVISVIGEIRKYDFITAIGAISAGVFVAVIASGATIEYFELTDAWGNGVAGLYGVIGRNLLIWLRRAAQNPPEAISSILRGWRR